MITPIKPINTCTPSHQPASLSVVGGLTKYIDSDGASQAYSTVLLIMVATLHVRDPGPRLMTARRYPLATKAFSLVSQLDQNRIRSRLNVLFIPLKLTKPQTCTYEKTLEHEASHGRTHSRDIPVTGVRRAQGLV